MQTTIAARMYYIVTSKTTIATAMLHFVTRRHGFVTGLHYLVTREQAERIIRYSYHRGARPT
jgi:hypothetical protein